MDPLSLSASVIAVLQLSGSVLSYLNSAKNLDKDLAKLTIGRCGLLSFFEAPRSFFILLMSYGGQRR